jgi:carotenoid cleavage dioxygenase
MAASNEVWFEAPHSAMIHDCALTKNYMVFPIMPYTSDLERLKAGGPHFVDGSLRKCLA